MTAESNNKGLIGSSVLRVEDPVLLTGHGCFVIDSKLATSLSTVGTGEVVRFHDFAYESSGQSTISLGEVAFLKFKPVRLIVCTLAGSCAFWISISPSFGSRFLLGPVCGIRMVAITISARIRAVLLLRCTTSKVFATRQTAACTPVIITIYCSVSLHSFSTAFSNSRILFAFLSLNTLLTYDLARWACKLSIVGGVKILTTFRA